MRIYVRRHTPRKGIRLILDTVSRMRDRATQCDTSQLGWGDKRGVTRHCLSLLTTPTKRNEHPPQPSMIGHEHPPPGLMVDDEGPLTSTKPTTRIDERLRGPITTINEGQLPGSISTLHSHCLSNGLRRTFVGPCHFRQTQRTVRRKSVGIRWT